MPFSWHLTAACLSVEFSFRSTGYSLCGTLLMLLLPVGPQQPLMGLVRFTPINTILLAEFAEGDCFEQSLAT